MANEDKKDFNAMLMDSKDMPKVQIITDEKSIEKQLPRVFSAEVLSPLPIKIEARGAPPFPTRAAKADIIIMIGIHTHTAFQIHPIIKMSSLRRKVFLRFLQPLNNTEPCFI